MVTTAAQAKAQLVAAEAQFAVSQSDVLIENFRLGAMDRLGLMGAEEWTVECNPATVSADKAKLLRDHGVNRISMGVQSLDEALLDRLGRVHTRDMVFRSFDVLRAGFPQTVLS